MRKNYLLRANAKQLLEYPIHVLFQTRFPWLTPNHARWLAQLVYAPLTLKTLAQR